MFNIFKKKTNPLVEYAASEFDRAWGNPPDEEETTKWMRKDLLDIVRIFSRQGHSGHSANILIGMLERVLRFEPLTPLTCKEDEWNECNDTIDPFWQNKRYGKVFKDKDGRIYTIDGYVFREPGQSSYWGGRASRKRLYPPISLEDLKTIKLELIGTLDEIDELAKNMRSDLDWEEWGKIWRQRFCKS